MVTSAIIQTDVFRPVVHKLRPAVQIQARQVARKVQQESLEYAKYGTSLPNCGITVTLALTACCMHIFQELRFK